MKLHGQFVIGLSRWNWTGLGCSSSALPRNHVVGARHGVRARVEREKRLLLYHGGVGAYVCSRVSRVPRRPRSSLWT
jgi:hypothetical protein